MRISDRYLAKQVFFGTIMAVVLICVVLIMGILFKEIRDFLVKYQAPPKLVAQFMLYSLPYPLMFALPLGFLATVLLTVGRLSSQNELVGFRTSGTSLLRLTAPIFALGLFFSVVCWFTAGIISPLAKQSASNLKHSALKQDPLTLLASRTQAKLPGVQIFITEKKDDRLKGFHLYGLSSEETGSIPETYVFATDVGLVVDDDSKLFILSFQQAFIEEILPPEDKKIGNHILASTAEPWPIAFPSRSPRDKPGYHSNFALFQQLKLPLEQKVRYKILAELQQRHALVLACFAFAFIGVPLGITSQRKEGGSGILMALIVALLYFILLVTAENFDHKPVVCATMMWVPNFICFALGTHLFRRASKR